jgi:hypothetical protein
VAQAADEPAPLNSISQLETLFQHDSINLFDAINAREREHYDLFPAIQSINMPIVDLSALNENAPISAPGTANTANTPSALLKTGRWRTDKAVIASTIFEAAWLTADGITTADLTRGTSEVGSTWAYGRHPTPGRTAVMMAAEFAGVEAASYMLHKMKAPKWIYLAPMIVSGSVHASGAIPNLKSGQ